MIGNRSAVRSATLAAPMPVAGCSPFLRTCANRRAFAAAAPCAQPNQRHLQHLQQQRQQQHRRSQRSTVVVVRASWGAPVEFSPAKVTKQQEIATDLHQVMVDIGDLAAGYTKPGQFVQIKVGDSKPGFFAIASAPDANNQGVLEFLIKKQGGAAELICGLDAGAEVSVSPVQGKGFPVEKIPAADVSTVLMFATGSGISPIKALIESGALELGSRRDVRLYYGTRSQAATAYSDLVPVWEAAGVKVIQVHSDSQQGYVQDVFAADKGISDAASTGVLLCGQKDMCNAVKELLAAEGVSADRVLLNF